MTDTNNIKVHYFRQFTKHACPCDMHSSELFKHSKLPGMHGKDPKYCKACVVAVVAVIYVNYNAFVGVAFRNPLDQFNRKIGRAIAIGIAKKNLEYDFPCHRIALADAIDSCYDNPTQDIKMALSSIRPYPRALTHINSRVRSSGIGSL